MAASIMPSTMPGGLTPQCNDCGIFLCWDISQEDYQEAREFWDAWKCEVCNGSRMSLKNWMEEKHGARPDGASAPTALKEKTNMGEFTTYLSERGIPLVFIEKLGHAHPGILTVENYLKWYSLYIVKGDGSVTKVEYDGTINMGDHVVNPSDLEAYAERHGYDICGQSMDMIVGRYVTVIAGNDPELVGIKNGYAPENAARRGENAKHFCSSACNPRDLSGAFHYFQNDDVVQRANDLADDYVEHLLDLYAKAA